MTPAQLILPAGRPSATAQPGGADIRTDHAYSAVIVAHGATGPNTTFTVAKGGAIPEMKGSAITATTNGHQTNHDFHTTNFQQPSSLGQALGDMAIDDVGLTLESAYVTSSTGALNTYGAGQQELTECLTKVWFKLSISSKPYIIGTAWMFPSLGGPFGSISTTGNAVTAAIATNGFPGASRTALAVPILAERGDTISGDVGIGNGSSLTFSVTSGVGQPCILWTQARGSVLGDSR